jgi:hypothetical protein
LAVLDWEAAFAQDYRIEVSTDSFSWHAVFDSHVDLQRWTSIESGQSPGVKKKTPLHVVHTTAISETESMPFKFLRLYIWKSTMGWGISLWQLDAYGILVQKCSVTTI